MRPHKVCASGLLLRFCCRPSAFASISVRRNEQGQTKRSNEAQANSARSPTSSACSALADSSRFKSPNEIKVMGRLLSTILLGASGAAVLLLASGPLTAAVETKAAGETSTKTCAGDNGGITLTQGFCATVCADHIGHARHMVVAPNGVVYVNTWSGTYYGNDTPPPGGFLVALQDLNGDGQADVTARFGNTIEQGDHWGTGIGIYKD